jgi:hypothetical protein
MSAKPEVAGPAGAKPNNVQPSGAKPAAENAGGPYKYVKVDDRFGRLARSAGGPSRVIAITRADTELAHVAPGVSQYIKIECKRLDTTLAAALAQDGNLSSFVAEAYVTSQHLRDVAESVGFSLVGFIATNLCTIFETMETARIEFPAAVVACHFNALRLAQSRDFEARDLKNFSDLSAGLLKTIQMIKKAARVGGPPKPPGPATAQV